MTTTRETLRQLLREHGGVVAARGILEEDADNGGWMLLTPEGQITFHLTRAEGEKAWARWCRRDMKRRKAAMSVGELEIRPLGWRETT